MAPRPVSTEIRRHLQGHQNFSQRFLQCWFQRPLVEALKYVVSNHAKQEEVANGSWTMFVDMVAAPVVGEFVKALVFYVPSGMAKGMYCSRTSPYARQRSNPHPGVCFDVQGRIKLSLDSGGLFGFDNAQCARDIRHAKVSFIPAGV